MDPPASGSSDHAMERGASLPGGEDRRVAEDFQPRSYQTKVFEAAMRRNTIAVLETGSGKTFIAVMLVREIGRRARENGEKPLMIFMAPTVHLINQQFKVIRDYTNFSVAEYYGTKGINDWSAESWEKELRTQEIMVMTPQILLDALRHAFLTLEMVCLMIFDECHRASGSHPYTKIMKEFYQRSGRKPAIFGMTASPVIGKGVSSAIDCEKQISELESILDSKVYTVVDRAELETVAPSAKETNCYYDVNMFCFEDLKTKLGYLMEKTDASLANLQESPTNQFQDTSDIVKASRKILSRSHQKILYCLDNLGLICAGEAAKVCKKVVRVRSATGESDFSRASSDLCLSFLEEVLRIIEETLPHGHEELIKTECGYLEGTKLGYISPKLDKLVQIFQSFGLSTEVLCLIFVERIIAAQVIEQFMKKISSLSHFSISYLTGGNSSKDGLNPKLQRTTMDLFRCGKVNLLFTTDVSEEGIHVPNCSWVIRFDLPTTVRSYVQSRGRARRHDSHYVLLLERGNAEQRDLLYDVIRSEQSVVHTALCRDPSTYVYEEPCCEDKINMYCVESTGATVTPNSSVNIIYKYCEKLPKDRYFIPKPLFQITQKEELYECMLTLPPNAAFQRLVGPLSITSNLAKQLVCFEACKKLHELGTLSNHLLPFLEEISETDLAGVDKEYASGAGTTKRKELHGMTNVRVLSGTWAHKPDTITLNAYKLNFVCNQEDENYSGFVLLIEAVLDDDVATAEFELYLIPNKIVKSSLSPCGEIQLNADQVERSKLFQEFFFNGIFGKLFIGSRSSEKREFLFKEGHKISWSSLNMYLLLPLNSLSFITHDTVRIHWKAINACVSAVEFIRNVYSLDEDYFSGSSSACSSVSDEENCERPDIFHLANKSLHIQYLRDSVVLAIHTGRIYSVLDVINDITPESPFDEIYEAKPSHFISFIDYYLQKYNIVLQHPGQPMLLLKQSHNPHNLFSPKSKFEDGSTGQYTMVEKEQVHAHIPPELLVHIDISTDIFKSFYLLPSVMQRLESLMLASQLRDEIGCSHSSSRIPTVLILEAITTLRCCENFSFERLELLGDSVLKYAVSCELFLKYPKKHEGQLSDHRSWAVCNSTLHKLGTGRSLQGYIRDTAFDPRRWTAPGQISLRPFPCSCGVDTSEVPLGRTYMTEDTSIVVGKACDRGHRWMCSKTIADCVEALIGAYFVGGGLSASLSVMRWLGINATFETILVEEAKMNASHRCYLSKVNEIETLELKLAYRFSVKGLLLEAITHPSQQESGIDYCYQRLEFLGDSVLDLLITQYLFTSHTNIDPGELTDLRSALVSNENFAQAAVRHNLLQHLQHGSGVLMEQITAYVKSIAEYSEYQGNEDVAPSLCLPIGPKVLGDMVESIAGAILIDTNLNLDKVWVVFEPLLSPIITPEKLALHPLRELIELCSCHGYFIDTKCTNSEEEVAVELAIQLKDDLLVGHGCDKSKKIAKAQAALCLLQDLKKRGISRVQYVSRRKQCEDRDNGDSCHSPFEVDISMSPKNGDNVEPNCSKKRNMVGCFLPLRPSTDSSIVEENGHQGGHSKKRGNTKMNESVVLPVKTQKGGPRTALFDLCKMHQWPMPKFESTEQKFRTPIVVNGVATPYFNSFTSGITLHIPNTAVVTLAGEPQTDKSRSQDSAALAMLRELEKQGRCTIREES